MLAAQNQPPTKTAHTLYLFHQMNTKQNSYNYMDKKSEEKRTSSQI